MPVHAQFATLTLLKELTTSTSTATVATTYVDTKGWSYATLLVHTRSSNTTSLATSIQVAEADDTSATSFVTVGSALTFGALSGTTGSLGAIHVDLRGRKRYLKLNLIPGTSTDSPMQYGVIGILNRAGEAPGSTSEMVSGGIAAAAQVFAP